MAFSILPPIHPGEILREEYLEPLDMSAGALARALGVPRTRIERLVAGQDRGRAKRDEIAGVEELQMA